VLPARHCRARRAGGRTQQAACRQPAVYHMHAAQDGFMQEPFVDLTAVTDHTYPHASMTELSLSALAAQCNVTWVDGPSVLFRRFNPVNIMHVLHDDLIPLHAVLEHFGITDRARLVHIDAVLAKPHADLYRSLSAKVRRVSSVAGIISQWLRIACSRHR
jgi:hypothetical protein